MRNIMLKQKDLKRIMDVVNGNLPIESVTLEEMDLFKSHILDVIAQKYNHNLTNNKTVQ